MNNVVSFHKKAIRVLDVIKTTPDILEYVIGYCTSTEVEGKKPRFDFHSRKVDMSFQQHIVDRSFIHTQLHPASTWFVYDHGFPEDVTLYACTISKGGVVCVPLMTHRHDTELILDFQNTPIAGQVILFTLKDKPKWLGEESSLSDLPKEQNIVTITVSPKVIPLLCWGMLKIEVVTLWEKCKSYFTSKTKTEVQKN